MKLNQQLISRLSQPMFWVGIIGGLKLFFQATNITISDAEWNSVANGMAGVFMLIGIIADYENSRPQPQPVPQPQPALVEQPKPVPEPPKPAITEPPATQLPTTPQG